MDRRSRLLARLFAVCGVLLVPWTGVLIEQLHGQKTMRPGRLAGRARGLLRCGVWAGPVFTATFVAEGAVRDGYRPLRHPVSSLALGPRGWVQTANFAVTGALCLAGAAG